MKTKNSRSVYDGWRLDLFTSRGVLIGRGYCPSYAPLRAFSEHFQDSSLFFVFIRPCSLPVHLRFSSDSSVACPFPSVKDGYILA